MKVIDSGMPQEAYWDSLFDIPGIVEWLNVERTVDDIVEIGCGYGTFTVPVAKQARGNVLAFDIDPEMLDIARGNIQHAGLRNVQLVERDILERGTGLDPDSVGMVLLFNILHFHERRIVLEEMSRTLKPGGIAAIIHWRKDVATPRGPSVQMRPDLPIVLSAIGGLDLHPVDNGKILEPYHWGIQLVKRP